MPRSRASHPAYGPDSTRMVSLPDAPYPSNDRRRNSRCSDMSPSIASLSRMRSSRAGSTLSLTNVAMSATSFFRVSISVMFSGMFLSSFAN